MIYWTVSKIIFKKKNCFNMFFFTSLIIHYFVQPNVIKEVSTTLICKTIDDHSYIRNSLDVDCQSDEYQTWVNLLT